MPIDTIEVTDDNPFMLKFLSDRARKWLNDPEIARKLADGILGSQGAEDSAKRTIKLSDKETVKVEIAGTASREQ